MADITTPGTGSRAAAEERLFLLQQTLQQSL
jgi:hypothetical protein